ncbi:histidine--tRNA ligase, putative [Hepatocystis sp. ex Piliocolobus tephrosceles]|nr:histidine--tRNA ligase, putative [Hepatocystis sp. ex Piliocolobus tephrosceles]
MVGFKTNLFIYFVCFATIFKIYPLYTNTTNEKRGKLFFFYFFLHNTLNKKKRHSNNIKKKWTNKKVIINLIKGTRVFDPIDYEKREFIFTEWKKIAKQFAYTFYDFPILDNYNLFKRSQINEAYDFYKHNRHLILRPEITPQIISYLFFKNGFLSEYPKNVSAGDTTTTTTTATTITTTTTATTGTTISVDKSSHNSNNTRDTVKNVYILKNLKKVLKVCTIGQCFRYEKISKNRKREHYQWNIDLYGINNTNAEIEILTILISFFQNVNLSHNDIIIKINNKKIIQFIINRIFKKTLANFSSNYVNKIVIKKILHILDKYKKITSYNFKLLLQKKIPYIQNEQISHFNNIITNVKNINDIKKLLNYNFLIYNDLKNILSYFYQINLHPFFEIDLTTVRGLDYYNNTIFETFYKNKNTRSICGGGRYDFYIKDLPYETTCTSLPTKYVPAVGFGMGDVVITDILFNQKKKQLFPIYNNKINVVTYFPFFNHTNVNNKNVYKEYYNILHILRNNNIKIYSLLQSNLTLSKALKKANLLQSNYFLFFNSAISIFILKNLLTGKQLAVNSENVLAIYNSVW